jgi:predicted signal transduction protein with EAL and GGDEF domain
MTAPAGKRVRVLIADDDEINLMLLREALETEGFDVTTVTDGASALREGSTGDYDIALLDVAMPRLDGHSVCARLRSTAAGRYLPIVMITSRDDSTSINRAYDAGATDFIAKPINWHLMPHRLRYVLRSAENEARARELADYDAVTGLPNGHSAVGIVAAAMNFVDRRAGCGLAVLNVEVTGLPRIFENFGVSVGNRALVSIARRLPPFLRAALLSRGSAEVARVGDSELLICVAGADIEALALEASSALSRWFREPLPVHPHEFFLEPVIGIALHREHGDEPEALMMRAATARDRARGDARVEPAIYTEAMGATARERIVLDAELRRALRDEELLLHFQPRIRLVDDGLAGVEALLRWFHPTRGPISPALFIALAEESSLILDIDAFVVRSACRQIYNWKAAGLDTRVSVNLSGRHFLFGDPVATIQRELDATPVDPQSLLIEITESTLMRDSSRAQSRLRQLRDLGCHIAIDDFGTGYSSLAYLKRFPADALKIDRAFIQHLTDDTVDAAIVQAVLDLSRSLGLSVTAEGVETETQLAWLRRHGCDDVQGYLTGRPVPAHEILKQYGATTASARHGASA